MGKRDARHQLHRRPHIKPESRYTGVDNIIPILFLI